MQGIVAFIREYRYIIVPFLVWFGIQLFKFLYDIVKDSVILLEQLRTIDKKRLKDRVCHLDKEIMGKVNQALCVSLELE